MIPLDPLVPWEPKSDRKLVWYAPPKNLQSHSFHNNNFICSKLKELEEMYKRKGNFNGFNYSRAAACVKCHDKEIRVPENLNAIEG